MNLFKSMSNTASTALSTVDTSLAVVNGSLIPVGNSVINTASSLEQVSKAGLVLVQGVTQSVEFSAKVEQDLYNNPEFIKIEAQRILSERLADMEISSEDIKKIIDYKAPKAEPQAS